jgi:hypothetical protein
MRVGGQKKYFAHPTLLRTINPYTDEPLAKFLGINGKSIKTKT